MNYDSEALEDDGLCLYYVSTVAEYTPLAEESMSADFQDSEVPAQVFTATESTDHPVVTLQLESCKENGLVGARLYLTSAPDGEPNSQDILASSLVSSDKIPARLGGCSQKNFGDVVFDLGAVDLSSGEQYALILRAVNPDESGGGVSWLRSSTPTDPSNPYTGGDLYLLNYGDCIDSHFENLDLQFSVSSAVGPIEGCIDVTACNYNPDANVDDGSCGYIVDCAGECGGGSVLTSFSFTKENFSDWTLSVNQDFMISTVKITRKNNQSIFNIAQEDGYFSSKPKYGLIKKYANGLELHRCKKCKASHSNKGVHRCNSMPHQR